MFSFLVYLLLFENKFTYDIRKIDFSYQILAFSFIIGLFLNLTSHFALSEDIYRYLFDGFLVKNQVNPYSFSPNMLSSTLTSNFPFYSSINNPDVSSPYPPLQIALSYLFIQIFGYNPVILLIIINFATCLTGFLIIKILDCFKLNRNLIILWSLNPNILLEFNSSGHNDIFSLLFLAGSIYLLARDNSNPRKYLILAAFFLSLSIGFKIFTIIIVPFIIRVLKKIGFISLIIVTSIQLIIFIFLINLQASGIIIFLKYWRFNGGLFEILYFLLNNFSSGFNILLDENLRFLLILSFGIIYCFFLINFFFLEKSHQLNLQIIIDFICYSFLVLFILSPVLHPWYVLWGLIPFILNFEKKLYPYWILLIVVNLSYVYYLNPNWSIYLFILEYGIIYGSLLVYFNPWSLIRRFKNTLN